MPQLGDIEQAALAINKALAGQTRGLLQYGISLSDSEKKTYDKMKVEEKSAFLQEKLSKSVGGFNEIFATSGIGIRKNFENAFGDEFTTVIGGYVSSAIGGIFTVFKNHLGFFSKIAKVIGPALNIVGEGLAAFSDILLSVAEGVFDIVSGIVTPIFSIIEYIGSLVGLGDGLTEQISKLIRVIGALGGGLTSIIAGIVTTAQQGFSTIGDVILWGINSLLAKIAKMLPESISSELDFLKNAQGNADEYAQKILNAGKNGGLYKLGDTVYEMMSNITDIMHGKTGKSDELNLLEKMLKKVSQIFGDTSDINETTKELGKNDEDYIQSIKDYIINRNQYYNNSNIDSRQYAVTVSRNSLNSIDESGRLGDILS